MRYLFPVLSASVLLALVSTAGDFVWANWRSPSGLLRRHHGIVISWPPAAPGGAAGHRDRRPLRHRRGAAGALSFYGWRRRWYVRCRLVADRLGILGTSHGGIAGCPRLPRVLSGGVLRGLRMLDALQSERRRRLRRHFVRTIAFPAGIRGAARRLT